MLINEPFAVGTSWIHGVHPRLRIVWAAFISFAVALSYQLPALTSALIFSIVLVGIARLPLRVVFKRLAVVSWFLLLLWLFLPITFEGPAYYIIGPLTFTQPGILLATQVTLKSITILLIFMSLIATMSIAALGQQLNRLHLPDKLVQLLLMTYRYIYVIEEEYQRLVRAIKIRGFRSGTNIHSYRTYAYLVGMLFVRAAMRAERVQQAMLCRGFRGRYYSLETFQAKGGNTFFCILMTVIIALQISLEWYCRMF